MAATRRPMFVNPNAASLETQSDVRADLIDAFHSQLPAYAATPLVRLDDAAKELGVGAVYLKDESSRLGLPSFKILGASWGTFRAIAEKLSLPLESDIERVKTAVASTWIKLFAATDGNHGRAVGRMGAILGVSVEIFVPAGMNPTTISLIESEGAVVRRTSGSYDEAVQAAFDAASQDEGILIQDTAFENYEETPKYIVEGYSTMMREIDRQLGEVNADFVIAPVGVGSFAQAVVSHCKSPGKHTNVIAVEPDTAACLWKDLTKGDGGAHQTYHTIMAGMDCGTVSSIAWPVLKSGVSASLTVSDFESHCGVQYLHSQGIGAGPCGAGPLAALRRMSPADKASIGLTEKSVVVLLCTEGQREYEVPSDPSHNDAASLTRALVQINSANPMSGTPPGPGESAIATYIAAWLEHRDIELHWIEPTKGRPSIIGVARGTGGGKSIMFNGHIDTVSLSEYEADPLSGVVEYGKLYGRGAADMKGGIAAALLALAEAKELKLKGDVIFAGVADEEANSIGTEDILRAGWTADGAVVTEPTDLDIVVAHKGFVWLEVDILGVAAHGSRADLGYDAIAKAGYFLVEIDKHAEALQQSAPPSITGSPSLHASLISGGEEASSYPAKCTITLERRTVAGETVDLVASQVREILERVARSVAGFKYDLRVTFSRSAFDIPESHSFSKTVEQHVRDSNGSLARFVGKPYWTDCALLADAGIPSVLFGPKGEGLHAKVEWVDIESVKSTAETLVAIARDYCS